MQVYCDDTSSRPERSIWCTCVWRSRRCGTTSCTLRPPIASSAAPPSASSATILEQPDDAGVFHLLAFEIRKLTQPERSYPPHLLKLLAVIHVHKALRPGPTYWTSLRDAHGQRQPAVAAATAPRQSSSGVLAQPVAEYQYSGVHISGRTHPADFLTRKRFSDGAGPAPHTGHDEPDSALELFAASGAAPASAFEAAGPAAESPG